MIAFIISSKSRLTVISDSMAIIPKFTSQTLISTIRITMFKTWKSHFTRRFVDEVHSTHFIEITISLLSKYHAQCSKSHHLLYSWITKGRWNTISIETSCFVRLFQFKISLQYRKFEKFVVWWWQRKIKI